MRILITNCALRGRSGTEVATMDLAAGLVRRGHKVSVFTPMVGASSASLTDQGIVVTDRLESVPWIPDVIHGHHNQVLLTSLAWFTDVPALFVCHSSNFWFDGAPLLPRVRRF